MTNSFRAIALLASCTAFVFAGCALGTAPPDDDDDAGSQNSPGGSSSGTTGTSGTTSGGRGGSVSSAGSGGTTTAGTTGTSGSGGTAPTAGTSATAGSAGSSVSAGGAGGSAGTQGVAGSGTAGTNAAGSGGLAGSGGTPGSAGTTGQLGSGMMMGMGRSSEQYATAQVSRDGVPYILITNGWGPGFGDHTVSWNGTSFIVESMNGSPGSNGQPASYPTVFCGKYSVREVPACGLPAAMDSIQTLKTGWRWRANPGGGEYNAAYDIWLGDGNRLQMYLMVWLHDPDNFQPAGATNLDNLGVTVANVPGVWNIWTGTVNNLPIINWVRASGMDSSELEFDVMDFVRDAQTRGLALTGTHINAVAAGFEIWQGPVSNLETIDFYVKVN